MPRRPTVGIYREFLLPASETFILGQARSLERFAPVLVGRRRVEGLELGNTATELVNRGGSRGGLLEVVHRAGFAPPSFARRVAARRPALLHAHFGPDALNALPLARRLEVPLIVTFHGYDAYQRMDLSEGFNAWRYGRRRARLGREAACLVTASEHMRQRLIDLGLPESKLRTHYIGVDTSRFATAPRDQREPVVLGVGRLVEKKGFADLIDAMAAVTQTVPGARLVLIGGGPLAGELRARARQAGLARFEMTGSLAPAAVARWMRRARVIAVPSVTARSGDTEATTMTVLEGMSSGLPAVATRHGGIPETIADGVNGLLVAERDVRGLAAALTAVLTRDQLWDRLSAESRRVVRQRFDLHEQTRALEDIYLDVLDRAPSFSRSPRRRRGRSPSREARHA